MMREYKTGNRTGAVQHGYPDDEYREGKGASAWTITTGGRKIEEWGRGEGAGSMEGEGRERGVSMGRLAAFSLMHVLSRPNLRKGSVPSNTVVFSEASNKKTPPGTWWCTAERQTEAKQRREG